jgi:hypothetical protein
MTDTETIAAAIHGTYRSLSRQEGWSMRLGLDRPYAELTESDKEDNRAAARRMGDVLAVAGLALSNEPGASAVSDDTFIAALEPMAEAEHRGWMAQRAQSGWTWGEVRDDDARRHPCMVPYQQLPESEKAKDRNNVRHYRDFAARAGCRIVRSK